MKTMLLLMLGVLLAVPAFADDPGSATAQFLKTGQGAGPMGMGGAYAALAGNVNSLYWNPGGMGEVATPEILFMHNNNYVDISNQYLGFVYPVEEWAGTIGLGVTYQDYGDIDRTLITGATTYTTNGSFGANDLAIAVGYGTRLDPSYTVGMNLKYIRSKIESEDANAFAVDLGLLWREPESPFSVGIALQNLGTKMKFISRRDNLPLNFKLGVAYRVLPELTFALDMNKPIDNDVLLNAGAEYWLADMFALRLGYDGMNEAGNGMTAGAGFRFEDMCVDYAWVDGGDLDDAHRVSLNFAFGPKLGQAY